MYLYEYEPQPTRSAPPFGFAGFGESGQLRRFSPQELQLDVDETRNTLKFFWPEKAGEIDQLQINDADREFAQGLLVEAIDASYPMGIMEQVYRRFFLRVPTSFKSIAKSAVKIALYAIRQRWLRRTQSLTSDQVKIYENVRVTLARNFRSVFEIRLQTGSY
jgi:hypothetical protein